MMPLVLTLRVLACSLVSMSIDLTNCTSCMHANDSMQLHTVLLLFNVESYN